MSEIYSPTVSATTRIIVLFDVHSEEIAQKFISDLIDIGTPSESIADGFLLAYMLSLLKQDDDTHKDDADKRFIIFVSYQEKDDGLYLLGGLGARVEPTHVWLVTDDNGLLASSMLADLVRPHQRLSQVIDEVMAITCVGECH